MDSYQPTPIVIFFIVLIIFLVYKQWRSSEASHPREFLDVQHNEFATSPELNPDLVGAGQHPQIHPRTTQTIHTNHSDVSNRTLDAVANIKGTGLFNGVEFKPRTRVAVQRVNPQDILAATTRPRGTPTPSVYKKNSNRQIRPEPVTKEGVAVLPTVSNLKDISKRETFSPLFSQSMQGQDFDL